MMRQGFGLESCARNSAHLNQDRRDAVVNVIGAYFKKTVVCCDDEFRTPR
jgi:hypothetical protein